MKGVGWQCDMCATRVVVEAPYGFGPHDSGPPPVGWLQIASPGTSSEVASDVWQLCSWECVRVLADRSLTRGPVAS